MSYLVLARKWRPQTFADVVAQSHVVQALQNAIRLERLPHALLLTGSRGVGKTTIARLIAKTVNCQAKERDDIEPCNQCDMCKEITEGRAVDVIEIDGASNRSIDDIRELRDNVQYLPTKGRRKVFIIDEVHMLTREAFNALLKTLEEPPEHVLFIFATTEPHKIPITILSRCQRFDFKRITLPMLRDYLKHVATSEGIELTENSLTMIARAAEGGMRDALSLLDQVIAFGGPHPTDEEVSQSIGAINRELLYQIIKSLLSHNPTQALLAVAELFNYAYDMRQLTQELTTILRDLLVIKLCQNPKDVTNLSEDELQQLTELAASAHPDILQQMFRILTSEAEHIAQSNHPRLLLEMVLLRMTRLEPIRPFDDLLRQLTILQERIANSHPSQNSHPSPNQQSISHTSDNSYSSFTPTPNAPSAPSTPTAHYTAHPTTTPSPSPKSSAKSDDTTTKQSTPPSPETTKTTSQKSQKHTPSPPSTTPPQKTQEPAEPQRSQEINPTSDTHTKAPISQDLSITSEIWAQLIKKFEKIEPFVAPILKNVQYRVTSDGILWLYFDPKRPADFETFEEEDKQEAWENFLKEQGYSLKVHLEELDENEALHLDSLQKSFNTHQKEKHQRAKAILTKEVEEHPVIQKVLQTFQGSEIVKITPAKTSTNTPSTRKNKA